LLSAVACTPSFAAPPTTATAAEDEPAKIRVGLIVSKLTADEHQSDTSAKTWGYQRNTRSIPELRSPDIEIVPIIEPGSEGDPELLAVLSNSFPDQPYILGDQVDDLDHLDVIVAAFVLYVPQSELDAIDAAVKHGRGLIIRQFMGLRSPGLENVQLQALCGVTSAKFFNSRGNELMKCKVIAGHPILGSLSRPEKMGSELSLYPNGYCGQYTGTPLVEVVNPDGHADLPVLANGRRFCPLFVSTHGLGNVVNCAFKGDKPIDPALMKAGADPFTIRTIKWLASESRSAGTHKTASTQQAAH
ncbi:MAG: hypothetical protein JWM57_238, partial [Phycisphaerales bacterium]|nr:hypothetical protein [Phycisphaerales bacterium]